MGRTRKSAVLEPAALQGEPGFDIPKEEKDGQVMLWPLHEILDNPYQPRTIEDPGDPQFLELADSIEKHGLRQIPTGRMKDGQVEISLKEMGDGHRRLRAFRYLQEKHKEDLFSHRWDYLPVFVQDMTNQEMADLVFEANEKRRDLNAIELANLTKRYLNEFGITQTEMATRRGVTQGSVANMLRLLEHPPEVQAMVISGGLKPTHAVALLRIKDDREHVIDLAKQTVNDNLSVVQVTRAAERELGRKWKPLHDQEFPQPHFKASKECKDCPNRDTLTDWHGKQLPYCTDPDCWARKQEAADEEKRAKVEKKGETTGVVDLNGMSWNDYQSLSGAEIDMTGCKDCDRRKLAGYGDRESKYYCFDPACYRKKKTALTKLKNKKAKEERETLWRVARKEVATDGPLPRCVLLHLLDDLLSHDTTRAVAKGRGIPTGQIDPWREALYVQLRGGTDADLRWAIIEASMHKRSAIDVAQYSGEHDHLARFVAALLPAAYIREFGTLPKESKDKYYPRLTDGILDAMAPVPDATVLDSSGHFEIEAPAAATTDDLEELAEQIMDEADREREIAEQSSEAEMETVETLPHFEPPGFVAQRAKAAAAAAGEASLDGAKDAERRQAILQHLPAELPCHGCSKVLECICQAFYHDETGKFHCDQVEEVTA